MTNFKNCTRKTYSYIKIEYRPVMFDDDRANLPLSWSIMFLNYYYGLSRAQLDNRAKELFSLVCRDSAFYEFKMSYDFCPNVSSKDVCSDFVSPFNI